MLAGQGSGQGTCNTMKLYRLKESPILVNASGKRNRIDMVYYLRAKKKGTQLFPCQVTPLSTIGI